MKKFITYIGLLIFLTVAQTHVALAQEAEGSAVLKRASAQSGFDYRVENLRNFLQKFDSPLSFYAQDFVNYADANGLDYRLVPAISGVESTFGKFIPSNSYNAYGWVNGNYSFKSWPNSIQTVSEALNEKYIQKGAVSIAQIARRYAPPSTTWGGNVKYFMNKIDQLPVSFDI